MTPAEIVQGSDEWYAIRLGKCTASRVADATARIQSGWGASRANYMTELLLERLTGKPGDGYVSAAMQRGRELQADAIAAYEFVADVDVVEIGFAPHPEIDMAGASPDGLVGDDGLVEIKCPNSSTHLDTLLGRTVSGSYIKQVQFQLACTGRQWCDWVSFDPRFPEAMQLFVKRVYRDEPLIVIIETDVRLFLEELDNKIAALRSRYELRKVLTEAAA